MKTKINLIFIILASVTFLSLTYKDLEPIKCFIHGNNMSYDVQLKINGVEIGNGYISDLKILSENHPLKAEIDDLPDFIKNKTPFVLKEGENIIELKYNCDSNKYAAQNKFSFALARPNAHKPLFYFSSQNESGVAISKFYVRNKNEEKENEMPIVGNSDAYFIFSQRADYFQAILNDTDLMSYHGSGGVSDLQLNKGNNMLKVKYMSKQEGELIYYVHTPNFTKKVIKNITKDQLEKVLVDTYEIKL